MYLLVALGILGLSAGPRDNGSSFRKSAAGFFLQFSLQISLEKARFGRSLVQLILAALSLYPFGAKEEDLFTAPQAPGLYFGLLERPALNSRLLAFIGENLVSWGFQGWILASRALLAWICSWARFWPPRASWV